MPKDDPSRLTFLRNSDRLGSAGKVYGWYKCSCGTVKEIAKYSVKAGKSKSCGCYNREVAASHVIHGMCRVGRRDSRYSLWVQLKRRCKDKKHRYYKDYGGRGITVCVRWDRSFGDFAADMGLRPKGLSINRVDNDKGYWCGKAECPECGPAGREPNCRWATPQEQMRNTRTNLLITHNGRTMCLTAWAEETGLQTQTLHARLKRGWSVERALSSAIRKIRGVHYD